MHSMDDIQDLNLRVRRVQDDARCLLTPRGSQEGSTEPDISEFGPADVVVPVSDVLSLPNHVGQWSLVAVVTDTCAPSVCGSCEYPHCFGRPGHMVE